MSERDRSFDGAPQPVPQKTLSARERFQRCLPDLLEFVADDYLFGVVDLMAEMNDLLAEWSAADPDGLEVS